MVLLSLPILRILASPPSQALVRLSMTVLSLPPPSASTIPPAGSALFGSRMSALVARRRILLLHSALIPQLQPTTPLTPGAMQTRASSSRTYAAMFRLAIVPGRLCLKTTVTLRHGTTTMAGLLRAKILSSQNLLAMEHSMTRLMLVAAKMSHLPMLRNSPELSMSPASVLELAERILQTIIRLTGVRLRLPAVQLRLLQAGRHGLLGRASV